MKNIKDEKRVLFKVFNQSTLRKKGEERRKQVDGLNRWRFMSERVDVDRERVAKMIERVCGCEN